MVKYLCYHLIDLFREGSSMILESYRDTWTEISLDAIRGNVKTFKKHINRSTRLMAVVKADAYGHGAFRVAETAMEAGADYLGVAFLDEAIELRRAGLQDIPILVLGYTAERGIEEAIKNNIDMTVYTGEAVKEIERIAEKLGQHARLHLKIDSGMNRIGISRKEKALEICQSIESPFVTIEGIFTHFADADNPNDSSYTHKQYALFAEVVDYLESNGFGVPIKHCCNSAATISFPEMHLDMVRVGISLYGLYPDEHLREKIQLRQAMSFKTKPVLIKQVGPGHPVSYGCTFAPEKDAVIATLPVGYADGFSRQLSNKGSVTIGGQKAPIVGRICMDQTMVDVTGVKDPNCDDMVTLFGEPSEGFISLGEVAEHMGTIHYEAACLIGKRVPRIYIDQGATN